MSNVDVYLLIYCSFCAKTFHIDWIITTFGVEYRVGEFKERATYGLVECVINRWADRHDNYFIIELELLSLFYKVNAVIAELLADLVYVSANRGWNA